VSELHPQWAAALDLPVGAHLHFDELVSDPPALGTAEWLPIAEDLVENLIKRGGRWVVLVHLGYCAALPTGPLGVSEALELADPSDLRTPPEVWHLHADAPSTDPSWEGQHGRWTIADDAAVTEVVSVSRSQLDADAGEPWTVSIVFQIGASAPPPE
jgi:hypothetical protein